MFQCSYQYKGNPTFQDTSMRFFFYQWRAQNAHMKQPHWGQKHELSVVWNKRHLVRMRAQSLIEFALRSILLLETDREGFSLKLPSFWVKIRDLRNHILFIFWWQWERYGSRKGTIQKYLENLKKNIQNRCLLDKSLLKSLKSMTFYSFTELLNSRTCGPLFL